MPTIAAVAAILAAYDIQPSMSRVGNSYDNAKAESFMKTLKQEEINGNSMAICARPKAPSEPLSKPCTTVSGCIRHSLIARLTSTKQHLGGLRG